MAGVTTYTVEVGTAICERIAEGESLRKICAEGSLTPDGEQMPSKTTVFRWLENPEHEQFRDQYASARARQAETLVDEILEIADDTTQDTEYGDNGPKANSEWISRSKLRVESRFKLMALLAPKKYGSKVDLTTGGEKLPGIPVIQIVAPT